MDTDVEELTCDSCGSTFNKPPHVNEEGQFCDFCYCSLLGNILKYPDQYRGQTTMARGLIESFNILQKEISEVKK